MAAGATSPHTALEVPAHVPQPPPELQRQRVPIGGDEVLLSLFDLQGRAGLQFQEPLRAVAIALRLRHRGFGAIQFVSRYTRRTGVLTGQNKNPTRWNPLKHLSFYPPSEA